MVDEILDEIEDKKPKSFYINESSNALIFFEAKMVGYVVAFLLK